MSAKQRKYFGGARKRRSSTRTVTRYARRARRSSGGRRSSMGGYLPLSMKETVLDFGVGALAPQVNGMVAGVVPSQLTSWAGAYEDEARLAMIGIVAHKFGSGIIKDAGREAFRLAVFGAGQETGARFIGTGSGVGASGDYM